jgi:hypothetical protein
MEGLPENVEMDCRTEKEFAIGCQAAGKEGKTMKVVINKCYGGFELSYEGVMKYAGLKGIKLYAFVEARDGNGQIDFHNFIPYDGSGENPFLIYYATVPCDEYMKHSKLWYESSIEKRRELGDGGYFCERDIERHDPALVETVEQLGEKANGRCAKLEIVTIPDDTEYVIEEYDGMEWIAEKHRTWN